MPDAPQQVVVLGGGIGGQVVATRLARRLGTRARVRLIERSPTYTFPPSLLWLMTGDRSAPAITRDYSTLRRRGVEVTQASVEAVDTAASSVRTDQGPVAYDYLVIALGATLDRGALPGVAEHAHDPYDLAAAERLRDALARFGGGRVIVAVASLPYKCPAAPYETAMIIDGFLRRRGLRDRSEISVYTPEPLPMPVAGPYAGHSVAAELAARSIGFNPTSQIDGVEAGILRTGRGDVPFDLAVVIPPHRPPRAIAESGLTGAAGWLAVDRQTLRTRASNVYAIGDAVAIPLENGMMLPKAGVFAHAQAEAVARNIAAQIDGSPAETLFDGHGRCFVETGDGKAGMASGDFYASPRPDVSLRRPSRAWHVGKVAFEQYWLRRWL